MRQSMKSRICAGVLAIAISVAGTNIVMANQPDDETVTMVDMYSIPEEYRTVDNFGPGFRDGVPADKVEGIELIVIEKSEHTVEPVTATEEVEVTVSPVIVINQDESETNNEEVTEVVQQEVTIITPQTEQPKEEKVEETKEEEPVVEVSTTSGNRWNISLNREEMDVLAKIVWKEARGESDAGEQAVVEVVLNRMHSSAYPNSCIGVLSQRGQFSTWKGRNSAHPSEREYRNIMAVLNGETNFLPFNTVYFSTRPQNKRIQMHLGCHYFCNQ